MLPLVLGTMFALRDNGGSVLQAGKQNKFTHSIQLKAEGKKYKDRKGMSDIDATLRFVQVRHLPILMLMPTLSSLCI